MSAITDTTRENQSKLAILLKVFDLSMEDVAKICDLSRPLISRALHGHSGINHDAVYAKLELHLPEIIGKRGKAFFQLESTSISLVEDMKIIK